MAKINLRRQRAERSRSGCAVREREPNNHPRLNPEARVRPPDGGPVRPRPLPPAGVQQEDPRLLAGRPLAHRVGPASAVAVHPDGTRPNGPAWYQTHTLAYAQELGHEVDPVETYLRRETGAYLDPWHDRLKTAYVDTLADLGVTADLTDAEFLAAMEHHKQADPAVAAVLSAIKATVKGGIGKLRERPQGRTYRDGDPWPAMERPTWRPDIRAAVISKACVNMHRKLTNMVKLTGLYPLAVLSDCVVYPSPGAAPLDFLPYAASGKPLMGGFRLGPTPGLAKLEGVQEMAWAVDLMEKGLNPARHIKGGDAVLDDGE